MIQVRHCDVVTELLQDKEKTDGVRSTGNTGQNSIARREHTAPVNDVTNPGCKFRKHGEK
jgi:hypothetical protein